jgi:hypothetical protein
MLTSIDDKSKSIDQAVDSAEVKHWKDAIVQEMEYLQNNGTCDLVKLPSGTNPISRKWVFKKKMNFAGQVENIKYQLVEKGYFKVKGVNFGEIFSLIEKLTSIRVLKSLATKFDIEIEYMDVNFRKVGVLVYP